MDCVILKMPKALISTSGSKASDAIVCHLDNGLEEDAGCAFEKLTSGTNTRLSRFNYGMSETDCRGVHSNLQILHCPEPGLQTCSLWLHQVS